MTDVVLDDAVGPAVALRGGLDAALDRVAHRVEAVTDAHGGDAGIQAGLGGVDEGEVLGASGLTASDDGGDGRVAVPALDLGAAVDRDDVALTQHPVAGYAVHDLLVDARAQRVAVAGDELEVGDAPVAADEVLGQAVELERRHARRHLGGEQLEGAPDEQAGLAHEEELLVGAPLQPVAASEHGAGAQRLGWAGSASTSRSVTWSSAPMPSTRTSRPTSS